MALVDEYHRESKDQKPKRSLEVGIARGKGEKWQGYEILEHEFGE